MPEHVIKQGECLSSVAYQYGLLPEHVWEEPANASLRSQRNDSDVLFPGDVLFIPEKRPRAEACSAGMRHRFSRKSASKTFELRLVSHDGKPLANQPYLLEIDGVMTDGRTDAEGKARHVHAPDARGGKLTFGAKGRRMEIPIRLGWLDPLDTVQGIQARLRNLRWYDGDISGVLDEATQEALQAFQAAQGLEVTGAADSATRERLLREYGE